MQRLKTLIGAAFAAVAAATSIPAQVAVGDVQDHSFAFRTDTRIGAKNTLLREHVLHRPGASYLAVDFDDVDLDGGAILEITGLQDSQTETLDELSGRRSSSYFNGDRVRLRLYAPTDYSNPGGVRSTGFQISKLSVGRSTRTVGIQNVCGVDDRRSTPYRGICRLVIRKGSVDYDFSGCLVGPNCIITSGSALQSAARVIAMFRVPYSSSTGVRRNPGPEHQYSWEGNPGSFSYRNGGVGQNWGVLRVRANVGHGNFPAMNGETVWPVQSALTRSSYSGIYYGFGVNSSKRTWNFTQQASLTTVYRRTTWLDHRGDFVYGGVGGPIFSSGRILGVATHSGCSSAALTYNKCTRIDDVAFASARAFTCGLKPNLRCRITSAPTFMTAGRVYVASGYVETTNSASVSKHRLSLYLANSPSNLTHEVAHYVLRSMRGSGRFSFRFTFTVPKGTRTGACWLRAYVDSKGVIAETTESDNIWTHRASCAGLPDLVATSPQTSHQLLYPGLSFRYGTRIRNAGFGASAATTTGVYLSTDTRITTTDLLLGSISTRSLAPNASVDLNASIAISRSALLPNANCWLGSYVDYRKTLTELREDNNTNTLAVRCESRVPLPDLRVRTFVAAARTWTAYRTVSVSGIVDNIGSRRSKACRLGFYLSSDSAVTTRDRLLSTRSIPELNPVAALAYSLSLRMPLALKSGTCYLGAIVDDQGVIAEANETNNLRTIAGSCTGLPDLVVSALSPTRTSLVAGDTVDLRLTVLNRGGAASRSFAVAFFLSQDTTIDTRDHHIKTVVLPGLGSSKFATTTQRVQVPFSAAGGTWYVGAFADIRGQVVEGDETGNTRTARVSVSRYTRSTPIVEYYPSVYPNERTSAVILTSRGGRADIRTIANAYPRGLRVHFWSASRSPAIDPLTDLSFALINTPLFARWVTFLDGAGKATAALDVPKLPGWRVDAWVHTGLFDRSLVFRGFVPPIFSQLR